jgi:hypothetical protein
MNLSIYINRNLHIHHWNLAIENKSLFAMPRQSYLPAVNS